VRGQRNERKEREETSKRQKQDRRTRNEASEEIGERKRKERKKREEKRFEEDQRSHLMFSINNNFRKYSETIIRPFYLNKIRTQVSQDSQNIPD
jgi:hypothetical protein